MCSDVFFGDVTCGNFPLHGNVSRNEARGKHGQEARNPRITPPSQSYASPCRKRSLAKKSAEKRDRSIRKSDQKVTKKWPKKSRKQKIMIELLLLTSFCSTLNAIPAWKYMRILYFETWIRNAMRIHTSENFWAPWIWIRYTYLVPFSGILL